jgi:DNA-binding CsgD family transcriptional regulator
MSPANGPLVGRDRDVQLVRAIAAGPRGRSIILFGEAGIGKSALLDDAARTAESAGIRVIRSAGVQFAESVSFGGLSELLQPVETLTSELTDRDRQALSVAFGHSDGPAAESLVLANAVLSLLTLAAHGGSLLVLVDDLQWLDGPSALTLGLVARRLSGTGVGLLAASRVGAESYFEMGGLPEHELQPLDDLAAAELLRGHYPDMALRVQERLVAEAGGNPLALVELPAALSTAQRIGVEPLPALLPLSRRAQQLFTPRIAALPEESRLALLIAALLVTGDIQLLQEVLSESGFTPGGLDDLSAAERAQLVRIDDNAGRVVFRHPIVRAAIVDYCGSGERRRAHQVLAAALADQPDRRAWHLARAANGPDEQVASLLAESAHRMLRRGDSVGAVSALVRAADLSPAPSSRSRRLAQAAYIAGDVTGELQRAPQLLAQAAQADPRSDVGFESAVAAAFVLIIGDGDLATAHRLLVSTIEASERDAGDPTLIDALWTLALVSFFGGGADIWAPFETALARLPEVPLFLSLCARTFADPVRRGEAALPELISAIDQLAAETDPVAIVRIGTAAVYMERLADCRAALWRVIRDGRQGGAVASSIYTLLLMGVDDVHTGLWQEGESLIDEGLALCEQHGYQLFSWPGRYGKALLAAARGDEAVRHGLTTQMMAWAAPRGVRAVQEYAWHAQALAALGRGDYDYAFQQAATISPAGTFASHTPNALWVAIDLLEAAARSGRQEEVAAHAEAMHEARVGALSPRFAAIEHAASALSATGLEAYRHFQDALAVPGAEKWAFDRARIELLYGERLRRDQALVRARTHLTSALDTFDRLGANPWADRAASELRAAGLRHAKGPPSSDAPAAVLTGREYEIAELAASGLSNKEIGERLFLSHRTVSDHLHKIFPKLGITTRAALRDALAPRTEPGQDR